MTADIATLQNPQPQDPAQQDLSQPNLSTPLIDPQGLDAQLQRMNTVEQTWGLPALPDSVKLDMLAHPGLPDANSVGNFMYGLNSDLKDATNPQQQQQALAQPQDQGPAPVGAEFLSPDDPANKLRQVWAGIAGQSAPEIVAPNAVQQLKLRAVEKGLLPESTQIDGSWDPQMRLIGNDLAYNDFQDRILGARPGAVRTQSVLDVLNDWTNPSHLLTAATALGVIPDFHAISNNFKDFSDSHNPFDLVKAAANIALPVINDVLLFTGVSEVVAFGRAAQAARAVETGTEALRGLDLANEIARGGTVLGRPLAVGNAGRGAIDAASVAADVERFSRPSWLAQHLPGPVADPLAAWRQTTASMLTRKTVQQGMKLGLVSQGETYIPGFSSIGIGGGGSQKDRIDSLERKRLSNPLTAGVSMALDLPFAPPSIFKPGTFVGPAQGLANWAKQATTAVSQDTTTMNLFHELISGHLKWSDPAEYQRYVETARRSSPKQALVAYLGNGDEQKAGEIMTHLVTSAALNQRAEREATALGLDRLTSGNAWDEAVHVYRNKFINQLRPLEGFDFDNPDDVIRYANARSKTEWQNLLNPENRDGIKGVRSARNKLFQGIRDSLLSETPEERAAAVDSARAVIDHHNGTIRQQTMSDLLSELTPEYLGRYVTNVWDRVRPDQWDSFVGANRRLEELYALGDLKLIDARQPGDWDWRPASFADNVPAVIDPKDMRGRGLDGFGGDIDPLKGHFTVMRQTELSRQQAAAVASYAKTLLERQKSLRTDDAAAMWEQFGAPVVTHLGGGDYEAGVQALADANPSAVKDAVKALFPPGPTLGTSRAAIRDYADTLRWVAKQGGDPAQALEHLEQQIRALDKGSFWASSNLAIGDMPLAEKVKALKGRLPFIAAEVEVPAAVRKSLGERGYKAVYGPDFLFPQDMVGLNGPWGELQRSHLRQISLGRFLTGQMPGELAKEKESAFRRTLAATMSHHPDVEPAWSYAPDEIPFTPDSADVHDIVGRLRGEMDEVQRTQAAVDERLRGGVLRNIDAALQQAHQPVSMFDLHPTRIHELFDPVYGEKGSRLIAGALREANSLGWQYEGLAAIESHLRANSWLKGVLKVLGKSEAGDSLGEWNGFKRVGVGVLSGALAAAQGANPAMAAGIGAAGGALYGEPTAARRIVTGAAGAGVALASGASPVEAAGAGALGAAAGGTRALLNPRFALGLFGASVAGHAALGAGVPSGEAALLGAATGFGLTKGAGALSRKALDVASDKAWLEYSRIGDSLAHLRDSLRFSLNPFFDARRWAKSMVRSGVADLPEGFTLPINPTLSSLHLEGGEEAEMLHRFRGATSEFFNSEAGDEMSRWAFDRGLLGFSPTRYMAGAFGHLVNQGMDDEKAANLVRKIYTYGSRTGLEKSVNFVFFPFSFEKKVLSQIGSFVSKDIGRTVMIHDALKAYDLLDSRFDLSTKLRDHAPILQDLQKLNMFEFGLSPGELGGVNRPLIEGLMSSPAGPPVDHVLNLFLPQALHIEPGADTGKLQQMLLRVIPAYRDVNYLLEDVADQGHVVFSDSHLTRRAEVSQAYDEWDKFKGQVEGFAKGQGVSWDQLMRSPKYAPMKEYIQATRAQIGQKYPAWAAARAAASEKDTLRTNELTDIVASPRSPAEAEIAQFKEVVDSLSSAMSAKTGTSLASEPDSVPAEVYDAIRNLAMAFARQGNGFEGLYDRYYASKFGPISQPLVA